MKGSCLCKAVQYEVQELAGPIMHCACDTCRKAHAASFNTGVPVAPEHFSWVAGEDKVASFESSPGERRHFCSVCGSHLVSVKEGAPNMLRAATLDDDPETTPKGLIWASHKKPWLNYPSGLTEYDEFRQT